MAQGKSSNSGKSGSGSSRPARPSGSSKAGASRSGTAKAGAAKTGTSKPTTANVGTSRPAGRGPAQRPPARRKNKSIVNQKQTPWGLIATIAAIVVFAAVIIVVVVVNKSGGSTQAGSPGVSGQVIPTTPTGATTKEPAVKQLKNTTGIKGVLAFDTGSSPQTDPNPPGLQRTHVTGPVDYSITPPAGGPHNAIWMNAGVYTKPVPSERAVHNLEHGAVWITYDPDLAKSKVAALQAFVGKQSLIDESQTSGVAGQKSRYMDLTPWASNSLPTPIVMSSWGFQLRLTSPTDPRMQKFVDMFRNSSKYTPEYGSPVDGQPVSTSGRAAFYGATKPNPAN